MGHCLFHTSECDGTETTFTPEGPINGKGCNYIILIRNDGESSGELHIYRVIIHDAVRREGKKKKEKNHAAKRPAVLMVLSL